MNKINIKKMFQIKNIGKEKLILLALAGIMLIGSSYFENMGHQNTEETVTTEQAEKNSYGETMEKKIKDIINSVKGVSNVNVMVTFKSGNEKILQEDSENSVNENGNNSLKKTTVIFNQNGSDNPYVIKEVYPEIEGVAVTAKGVESGKREQIINMLAALFDIPIHKISVIEND